jgi:Cys-tRNA synthase (O-phospho-L-seryl-tRNA:Cys-tRNA synthase)
MLATGRGGGWNNFSGLSSPIINWYNAYHRSGTVSTGFGTLVTKAEWSEDLSRVSLTLEFDKDLAGKEVAIIACLADGPRELKLKATKKPLTISVN